MYVFVWYAGWMVVSPLRITGTEFITPFYWNLEMNGIMKKWLAYPSHKLKIICQFIAFFVNFFTMALHLLIYSDLHLFTFVYLYTYFTFVYIYTYFMIVYIYTYFIFVYIKNYFTFVYIYTCFIMLYITLIVWLRSFTLVLRLCTESTQR